MGSTAEIKRLQSCINDLISVLALPAIWSGSKSSQILSTLLDVLLTMLRLDFAYARLGDASHGPPIEVVRLGDHRHSPVQPQQFGQALDRWLTDDQTASRCVVPYLPIRPNHATDCGTRSPTGSSGRRGARETDDRAR